MIAALRWGTRGPPDALTPSPEQTRPCLSPCSKALSLCSVQCPRENRPRVGLGGLGLVRFGFQSLLEDVPGQGRLCLPRKQAGSGTSLLPVSRPQVSPRTESLLQGVGLARALKAPGLQWSSPGGSSPWPTLPPTDPSPPPALWTKVRPRGPTLGLKAMSFRTISTVKRPVKSILRMFMAILNRQL